MRPPVISIIILSAVLATGCRNSKSLSQNQQKLAVLLQHLKIKPADNQVIIIAPVNGCSGCLQHVIRFARKYTDNRQWLFVFSGYGRKEIVLKTGNTLAASSHVIVDDQATALKRGLIEAFPVLFILKQGELVAHKEMTATNIEDILQSLTSWQRVMPRTRQGPFSLTRPPSGGLPTLYFWSNA